MATPMEVIILGTFECPIKIQAYPHLLSGSQHGIFDSLANILGISSWHFSHLK
jgi:hypothetical protein